MENEQNRLGPLTAHAPVHPDSTDVTVGPVFVGLAIKVTFAPMSKVALHVAGARHFVLPGSISTVPAPAPANDTVNV
jgi:hypothetical protein